MDMAKTIDELTKQFLDLCIEVNDNMKKLINTKGEKVDGDYPGMRYVPTESQQKNLAFFADRKIVPCHHSFHQNECFPFQQPKYT